MFPVDDGDGLDDPEEIEREKGEAESASCNAREERDVSCHFYLDDAHAKCLGKVVLEEGEVDECEDAEEDEDEEYVGRDASSHERQVVLDAAGEGFHKGGSERRKGDDVKDEDVDDKRDYPSGEPAGIFLYTCSWKWKVECLCFHKGN